MVNPFNMFTIKYTPFNITDNVIAELAILNNTLILNLILENIVDTFPSKSSNITSRIVIIKYTLKFKIKFVFYKNYFSSGILRCYDCRRFIFQKTCDKCK